MADVTRSKITQTHGKGKKIKQAKSLLKGQLPPPPIARPLSLISS
jgi:hypothetical protein